MQVRCRFINIIQLGNIKFHGVIGIGQGSHIGHLQIGEIWGWVTGITAVCFRNFVSIIIEIAVVDLLPPFLCNSKLPPGIETEVWRILDPDLNEGHQGIQFGMTESLGPGQDGRKAHAVLLINSLVFPVPLVRRNIPNIS